MTIDSISLEVEIIVLVTNSWMYGRIHASKCTHRFTLHSEYLQSLFQLVKLRLWLVSYGSISIVFSNSRKKGVLSLLPMIIIQLT